MDWEFENKEPILKILLLQKKATIFSLMPGFNTAVARLLNGWEICVLRANLYKIITGSGWLAQWLGLWIASCYNLVPVAFYIATFC